MSVWSLETVDLENDVPTSSDEIRQLPPNYESDNESENEDNGPCDSTTTRQFDRLMSWLQLSIPDRTEPVMEEFPIGEDYPDQSCWVQPEQGQQDQEQEQQEQQQVEQMEAEGLPVNNALMELFDIQL